MRSDNGSILGVEGWLGLMTALGIILGVLLAFRYLPLSW